MLTVISGSKKDSRLKTKKLVRPSGSVNPMLKNLNGQQKEYADRLKMLADVAHQHPWTYATVDAVARSVVGSGWKIVPVERHKSAATPRGRKKVQEFFDYDNREWSNIRDFMSLPDKLAHTVSSYRLFGQAAWELLWDGDELVGFDVLPGIVVPNVDSSGYFSEPAFKFSPWDGSGDIDYDSDEIAYFFNPGITGRIMGESAYEPLANISLPSDIFAAVSYRSMFENINAPYNGVWVVDSTVSDEDFDTFVELLQDRYSGAESYGRNPLVIRGMAEFKELETRRKDDAPYLEGRQYNREEMFAVTGVPGNKLGISSDFNKANIRETRREFHESVLRPIFASLEQAIYHQVISRSMNVKGWMLQFNRPDITTALEQASIDMRYLQWGIYSPNEIRAQKGEPPRKDGENYYVPSLTNSKNDIGSGQQGKKDDAEPDNPDRATDPLPVERPPRDESMTSNSLVSREVRNWKKITLEYMDGKRPSMDFVPKYIDDNVFYNASTLIKENIGDFDAIKKIFSAVSGIYEKGEDDE